MTLILELIVLGIIFYFSFTLSSIPMADPFPKIVKAIAIVIAIVIALFLVLTALGVNVPLRLN